MSLEEEIKQIKFESEYHKMILNIAYTSNWMSNKMNDLLKPYGISQEQYNILRILKGQKGKAICNGDIQNRMLNKMSNVSRLVEKLRKKDYVKREENVEDRRAVLISITELGLNVLKETESLSTEFEKKFKDISIKDAKIVNSLLDKIRE